VSSKKSPTAQKEFSIVLAEEIQDKRLKRVIDAIDPALITATTEKVASAFSGSTLMTEAQKSQADKTIITYNRIRFKRSEAHTDES
jgi:hypothetical protein